ncbi:MAG TPA: YciI family protein [Acidimicrobiales bacterium]
MTQYLLSVNTDWSADPPAADQMERAYQAVGRFNVDLQKAGAWVFAGGLQPPGTATVTRVGDGEVLTTDGPFAETKEQLGGIWIIEAPDLDAALDWSAKASRACGNPVEVRPFQEVPQP